MRTLIFNADDYGLSPAVSRGILESAQGVVRATSVMANYVTEDEARKLNESGLSVGAHLNLSSGRPLSPDYPATLLNKDGRFDKSRALFAATWRNPTLLKSAVAEWRAQLLRLEELGIVIDHLDSHHHTHMLPGLLPIALKLAAELDLPLRLRRHHRRLAARARVRCPDDFLEGYFGYNNINLGSLWQQLNAAYGDVVEVMCHPASVDAELRERSGYLSEREIEREALGSPELAIELEQKGWKLAGYEVLG